MTSKKITRNDIAWLAGIIDGEGCVGQYQNGRHPYLQARIDIANTDFGILNEVRRILDGWFIVYSYKKSPSYSNRKQCYYIRILRKMEVRFVLEKCLPYLKSIKGYKAIAILEKPEVNRKDGKLPNIQKKMIEWRLA